MQTQGNKGPDRQRHGVCVRWAVGVVLLVIMVVLFAMIAVSAEPEILTTWKVSMWGMDSQGNVCVEPYVWGTNAGVWQLERDGTAKAITNIQYDFWWKVDTNGYIVPK